MNLLAGQLKDVQVNTVSTRTHPAPFTKRSPTKLQLRPPVLHLLKAPVGIRRSIEIKHRTIENPVRSQKTSSLAGGASLPTCRFLQVEF